MTPKSTMGRSIRPAFTLVELLVTIAIIGILMAISLPGVMAVRNSARRAACQNKLRQLGIALSSFQASYRYYPSGKTTKHYDQFSWSAQLLPFIEQEPLWNQLTGSDDSVAVDGLPVHLLGLSKLLPAVHCPSNPDTATLQRASNLNGTFVGLSDYLGVAGQNHTTKDGVFFLDSETHIANISGGLSNTLFVGERPPSFDFNLGWWFTGDGQDGTGNADLFLGMEELNSGLSETLMHLGPGPYSYQNGAPNSLESVFHFWSYHSGGANFAYGDGSVHFLAYTTDRQIMLDLSTVH